MVVVVVVVVVGAVVVVVVDVVDVDFVVFRRGVAGAGRATEDAERNRNCDSE